METFRPCGASKVFSVGALPDSAARLGNTPASPNSISPTETTFVIVSFIVTICYFLSSLMRRGPCLRPETAHTSRHWGEAAAHHGEGARPRAPRKPCRTQRCNFALD